jgi:hypothetical protein
MRITSGGNVGIGTTSPQNLLEIRKDQNAYTRFIVNNNNAGGGTGITFARNTGTYAFLEYDNTADTFKIQNQNNGNYGAITLNSLGGNVGINTSTPIAKLDVEGDFQLLNANYNSYSSSVSGTTTLATIPTSSYNGVFFDFVAFSGSNQRAGTLIGNWRSGNVQYTEYSSPDIGSTAAALTMSVALSGANALVQSVSAPGWAIKATYRTV